ncbi:hypothetical protein [Gimesia sp.]|uniref:hypothetical protein n=1 Tax=Gimesia sp. TaxID=2024833 RepID=UPI003A910438
MSNPYTKKCNFCGQQIRMAEMKNGQWLPFEIDGSGKHECQSASVSPAVENKSYRPAHEPKMQKQEPAFFSQENETPQLEAANSRSCILPFLVLILFFILCVWLLFSWIF